MTQIVVLAEDRIVDNVPRVAGEVVQTAEALPPWAIRRVLVTPAQYEQRGVALALQVAAERIAQAARDAINAHKPPTPEPPVNPGGTHGPA